MAGKRRAAHPIEDALQLGAVPPIGAGPEFVRQARNILTKFVHETPLDSRAGLDYQRRQLICGMDWSQLGDGCLWGTGQFVPTTRFMNPTLDQAVGMQGAYDCNRQACRTLGSTGHDQADTIRAVRWSGVGIRRLRLG
jgi:hypothetical protein